VRCHKSDFFGSEKINKSARSKHKITQRTQKCLNLCLWTFVVNLKEETPTLFQNFILLMDCLPKNLQIAIVFGTISPNICAVYIDSG
jgi:hypothetical protein